MKKLIPLLFGIIMISFTSCINEKKDTIKSSIQQQIEMYPQSTLCDIYKSFFQDRFGPGHLIADTASAGKYLRHELSSMDKSLTTDYEPTGSEGNFYRVNLSVLKDGRVSYDVYFNAFIESVNNIKTTPIETWKTEWQQIQTIIDKMNLNLYNYENDKILIDSLLNEGIYVMHHSREYNAAYEPHYRIIEKSIFENELLPLIEDNKNFPLHRDRNN